MQSSKLKNTSSEIPFAFNYCKCRLCIRWFYFIPYRYGIVLKRSGYDDDAQAVFLKSIEAEPCLWSAWHELASLLKDKSDVRNIP